MTLRAAKKYALLFLMVCALTAFAGCSAKAAIDPTAANGNGTPAVNLDDGAIQDSKETEGSGTDSSQTTPQGTDASGKAQTGLSSAVDPETGELNPALAGLPAWEDDNIDGPSAVTHQTDGQPLFAEDTEVIEIKEKMFVAQSNEIYYNAGDYLGKTIQYEGIFSTFTDPETNNTYYSVIRYGPGCCGIDNNCGFEVIWEDGLTDYPKAGDWVEVVGVLDEYEENGLLYLQIDLNSLKVLDTRGAENVTL